MAGAQAVALALLTIMSTCALATAQTQYTGGYACDDGYTKRTGEPVCATALNSGCTDATCCVPPRTCSEWSGAWILAQAGNGGCRKDGAKMFFDTKKIGTVVASPHGDAQVKAACCTANSDAKCSDWVGVYSCTSGTTLSTASSAAPDGTDGNTFSSVAKFREVCCGIPLKCSAFTGDQSVSRAAIHAPFTMVTVVGAIATMMC